MQVLLLSECMLAVIRAHKADVKAERAATADCAAEKMPTDTPAVSGTATAEENRGKTVPGRAGPDLGPN